MNADWRRRLILLGTCCALAWPLHAAQKPGAEVQDPAPESRTLVILGASYAKGWGSPAMPGYERVLNRGVGGEETGDMLARFPTDVAAARPAAVLIWGHVNNISRARPERIEDAKKAARGHYAEMLRQARAAGIAVIIATEVPWTDASGILGTLYGWYAALRGRTSYARRVSAHVAEVNDELRKLCARESCRVLDFERLFANEDGTRKTEFGTEDGSHITAAGYDALTAYARRELNGRP